MAKIHPTVIIDPKAELASDVEVGPYSIIGPNVKIGSGTTVGPHCILDGYTTMGSHNRIFAGAIVGSIPQDLKYKGGKTYLEIGDENIIREYVTLNPGTDEGTKTVLGNKNELMAYVHVAHDCIIGNGVIIANAGTLAGYVTVEDKAVVGGLSAVHQFVRLGRLSIVGGCSKVVQDIPPFSMCDGHPAKVYNLNLVGLRRAKISLKAINLLKKAFKILFFSGLSKTHAIAKIEQEVEQCPEVEHVIFFAKTTARGVCS